MKQLPERVKFCLFYSLLCCPGWALGHDRECEGKDSGQRGNPTWSVEVDLCWWVSTLHILKPIYLCHVSHAAHQVNSWRMEELCLITTFKRSRLSILCSGGHDGQVKAWWFGIRLRGGAKKRKKKNYTTPKKIKHKHQTAHLAELKYYKVKSLLNLFEKMSKLAATLQVDDNGKINRLRRECPAEECGAGVFMAAHHDRQVILDCRLVDCSTSQLLCSTLLLILSPPHLPTFFTVAFSFPQPWQG